MAKAIKLLIGDSVDKVHEGSNLVEQAAAAAMQDQAARLARAVSVFKLDRAVAQESSLAQGEARLALRQANSITTVHS